MFVCKYYKFIFIVIAWLFATLFIYVAYLGFSERRSFRLLLSSYNTSISENEATPLTIQVNHGRLGNQMYTYAALLGLSTLNNRKMQIMPENYDALSKYFDIKTPVVNQTTFVEKDPWLIKSWLKENDHHIPRDSNIIKGKLYPNSYTFFHHIRLEVRRVFRFKPSYVRHAQGVLWEFTRRKPQTQVYVGVHVRRGDYLDNPRKKGWLMSRHGREVDVTYFEKAVEHFTSKFNNVTFLAVSDDRNWCRTSLSHLGILTVPDSPSPGHDMALLAECNHTIVTYGTFGFWGGYLSGGDVVYFSDFLEPNTTYWKDNFRNDKMYLPEWTGISTTKPGFWESHSTS